MREASKHKNSESENTVSSQELITESIKKENKFKIRKTTELK